MASTLVGVLLFRYRTVDRCNKKGYNFYKVRYGTKIQRKTWCYIMDYLKVLVEEIHSVVVATVDETGHPHTAVMDMMWEDGKTVYFLTADFKPLYKRLKEDGRVALTGMTQGAGTMDRKSISLTGQVEWIGKEHLEEFVGKPIHICMRFIRQKRGVVTYKSFVLKK